MTRVMGIDYGESRIGIAVAETEIGIAHPHSVIDTNDLPLDKIAGIIRDDGIQLIVVGLPRNMDGTEGGQAESVRSFAGELSARAGIEIVFQDERLTSKQAEDILLKMDKSRDARKVEADAHQAAIILQTYLDSTVDGNNAWDS